MTKINSKQNNLDFVTFVELVSFERFEPLMLHLLDDALSIAFQA